MTVTFKVAWSSLKTISFISCNWSRTNMSDIVFHGHWRSLKYVSAHFDDSCWDKILCCPLENTYPVQSDKRISSCSRSPWISLYRGSGKVLKKFKTQTQTQALRSLIQIRSKEFEALQEHSIPPLLIEASSAGTKPQNLQLKLSFFSWKCTCWESSMYTYWSF